MLRQFLRFFVLLAFSFLALPSSGDEGEGVPYVRTPQAVVDAMLDLAQVGVDDFVIDLGSGDGRIILSAAKERGARGFGVDIDPRLVAASNRAAQEAGVADRAEFFVRDLFETDLSQATVLTMYLLPEFNLKLRPRILNELRPGTRVLSHDWDMGDWQPDAKLVVDGVKKPVMPLTQSSVYMWIVPAKAAGAWIIRIDGVKQPLEIDFAQRFQQLSGSAQRAGKRLVLDAAKLRGEEIRFAVAGAPQHPAQQFIGRVNGDAMEGTTAAGKRWRAERKQ